MNDLLSDMNKHWGSAICRVVVIEQGLIKCLRQIMFKREELAAFVRDEFLCLMNCSSDLKLQECRLVTIMWKYKISLRMNCSALYVHVYVVTCVV